MSSLENELLHALRHGASGSRTRLDLRTELGISDRSLRRLVESLRQDGVLIGSSNDRPGYFLIATLAEAEVTAAHMRARAITALRTVTNMRRSAAERFGEYEATRLFELEAVAS